MNAIGRSRRLKSIFTKQTTGATEPITHEEPGKPASTRQVTAQQTRIQRPVLNIQKVEKPVSRLSGFSIKLKDDTDDVKTSAGGKRSSQEAMDISAHNAEINPTDLIVAWRTFAQNMPHEYKAMSQRMDQLEPKIISQNEFEIIVENPTILGHMKSMSPRIVAFLRSQLSHPTLQMRVTMRELDEVPLILSKPEQVKLMRDRSKAFERLEREFALTL